MRILVDIMMANAPKVGVLRDNVVRLAQLSRHLLLTGVLLRLMASRS